MAFVVSFILGISIGVVETRNLSREESKRVQIISDRVLLPSIETKELTNNSENTNPTTKNKCYKDIPDDVPIYPTAECAKTENNPSFRGVIYGFSILGTPIKDIAVWYAEKMKLNQWEIELDVSELGDTFVIYKKLDNTGNTRLVGIDVHNTKAQPNHRVIFYPNNFVVPRPCVCFVELDKNFKKPNKRCSGLGKSAR